MVETVAGLCAVAIVTFMVLWLGRHGHGFKAEMEVHAAAALATGTLFALVPMLLFVLWPQTRPVPRSAPPTVSPSTPEVR